MAEQSSLSLQRTWGLECSLAGPDPRWAHLLSALGNRPSPPFQDMASLACRRTAVPPSGLHPPAQARLPPQPPHRAQG